MLWGHLMPITRLSCFLWKLFSFLWSLPDNPQVPLRLLRSMLLTYDSYGRSLVFSFVFHFVFHTISLFDNVMLDSSFLRFISSRWPSFDNTLLLLSAVCILYPLVSKQRFILIIFPSLGNNYRNTANMKTGTEIVNLCILSSNDRHFS